VALITGAGSGIGRATSKIFAREGAKLVLADVVEAGGYETLKMVTDAGARRSSSNATSPNGTTRVQPLPRRLKPTDVSIVRITTPALRARARSRMNTPEENWNRVISINLTGVWLCMKAEIAQILKQGGNGAIVNTSSGAGLAGVRGMPAYVASKHGVAGLTRAAARVRQAEYPHQCRMSGANSHADARMIAHQSARRRAAFRPLRTSQAPRRTRGNR